MIWMLDFEFHDFNNLVEIQSRKLNMNNDLRLFLGLSRIPSGGVLVVTPTGNPNFGVSLMLGFLFAAGFDDPSLLCFF